MYNRSRYGRNNWYMAFFWAFVGFVLGQITPQISFSVSNLPTEGLRRRAQLPPPPSTAAQLAPTQTTPAKNITITKTGDFE